MTARLKLAASILLAASLLGVAAAQTDPDITHRIGIDQHMGAQVPMDTPVVDEHGKHIEFGDVFHGRPVLFMPIFYSCQSVCSIELSEMLKTAIRMKNTYPIGEKFDWVILSIHPKETPDLALAKEKDLQEMYDRPASLQGWHLLTASEANIRKITNAIGFRYEYNAAQNLINHPAGSMVLTPEGQVSSYVFGTNYDTRPLQDALNLAAENKVGKKVEVEMMLGCIMLDPATGRRTLVVNRILIISGCLTVVILAASIIKMSLSSRAQSRLGGAL